MAFISEPKPSKESYLANLRILKESHVGVEHSTSIKMCASPHKAKSLLFEGENVFFGAAISSMISPEDMSTNGSTQVDTFHEEISRKIAAKLGKVDTAQLETTESNRLTSSVASARIQTNRKLSQSENRKVRFGSKAVRRFTAVAQLMPDLRLDKKMKEQIAERLKSMECWSDDEDNENVTHATDDGDSASSDSDKDTDPERSTASHPPQTEDQPNVSHTPTEPDTAKPKISPRMSLHQPIVVKQRATLARPVQIRETVLQRAKHTYLEQQKQLHRAKAAEAVLTRAVKCFVKVKRKEEKEYQLNLLAQMRQLSAVEKQAIERITRNRVVNIISKGLSSAVQRILKEERREKRRIAKRNAAQIRIFRAWRKHRVRILLMCVVEHIREKARQFREQQEREERDFRMRTAMRRVREDADMRKWIKDKKQQQQQHDESLKQSKLKRSHVLLNSSLVKDTNSMDILVPPVSPERVFADTVRPVQTTMAPNRQSATNSKNIAFSRSFEYHRPDLAPFSTMINNMIQSRLLYKPKEQEKWEDVASVSSDFIEHHKAKKKSAAYKALEKFCGKTEQDVLRSKLAHAINDYENLH